MEISDDPFFITDPTDTDDPSGFLPVIRFEGTRVHGYLGNRFLGGRPPGATRFSNRRISTLLLAANGVPTKGGLVFSILRRRRPDLAELNATRTSGTLYEIKHADVVSPAAVLNVATAVTTAYAQLLGYRWALNRYSLTTSWSFGATWPSAGGPTLTTWPSYASVQYPGSLLITLTDPKDFPGVVIYDLIPTTQSLPDPALLFRSAAVLSISGILVRVAMTRVRAVENTRLGGYEGIAGAFAMMGVL
jgi:hypothetical protein